MDDPYWHQQTVDKPLFPDLLWSRPENKRLAGKLLIIGGNLYGFAAPAEAYQAAMDAGIGVARVLLPDCLYKTLRQHMDMAEFAPSNPSGSFAQDALGAWLEQAAWSDGVLLAGDFGRNSETAIVIEKFLAKYSDPLIITKDAADYITANPAQALNRPNTTLVLSLSQLQRLAKSAGTTKAVTFKMDLLQLVDWLHDFTENHSVNIIVRHLGKLFVAVNGQVSTTKLAESSPSIWRVKIAAGAATWLIQQLSRPFEALSTSVRSID
jgi:hypothetical protein